MLVVIPAIVLCALALALGVEADIRQSCNRALDAHCVYTPAGGPSVPILKVDYGRILDQSDDGAGSRTYLAADNTKFSLVVDCAGGGTSKAVFVLGHDKSSATVDGSIGGPATLSFNDNTKAEAKAGQTLTSSTPGVDASISCPPFHARA